jgi:hypothetical protein
MSWHVVTRLGVWQFLAKVDDSPDVSRAPAVEPSTTWQDVAIALFADVPTNATPHLDALAARDIDSLHYLRYEPQAAAQRLYDKVWTTQRTTLEFVVARCLDRGVSPVVWKGAEFLAQYFNPHALGALGDIDLIVPRTQVGSARNALVHAGFRNTKLASDGRWQPLHPLESAKQILEGTALPPFRRAMPIELEADEQAVAARLLPRGSLSQDGTSIVVTIDLHHNAIEPRFPIMPMMERAESSAFSNARAFVAEDHLWLSSLRYYMEVAYSGKRSLRHLAFLIGLLEAESLDWDEIIKCARAFRAVPALYYTLGMIAQLRPGLVQGPVLDALDPSTSNRSCDFGWQLGLLLDFVEPCPRWGWS